ncbi:hypothetical protein [Paenibacillus sp. FSL H3-0469]|uniref:hypothetical protein n=1 Tax=Paenibacillus sp. FSL H3-0469 TaxID=2954506 RepID=UPI003100C4B8
MSQLSTKPIHPGAMDMINRAIRPLLSPSKGCSIDRLKICVNPQADIAEYESIQTSFGALRVSINPYVTKGVAYVVEEPGRGEIAFAWVNR